jgi:hypothetical protein
MARSGRPAVKNQEPRMIANPSRIVIRVILALLRTRSSLSVTNDRSTGGMLGSFCDPNLSISGNEIAAFKRLSINDAFRHL